MNSASREHDFLRFREKHPVFIYEAYQVTKEAKGLKIKWTFRMPPDVVFEPTLLIPAGQRSYNKEPDPVVLDALAFQAGMVELISYWKAACPPDILIQPHRLTPDAAGFWEDLYYMGLGEFRYLNGIRHPKQDFLKIHSEGPSVPQARFMTDPQRILLPIGGGKDSAVSLAILRESGRTLVPFLLNPLPAAWRTLATAGLGAEESLVFRRSLDPALLELNHRGYLNGHTPFSALLAFYTLLASHLSGCGQIALSNESSANEATVPGTDINHQYSKSSHFEDRFRQYVSTTLGLDVDYFSLLRPLNELQIAALFAKRPAYHGQVLSCNAGGKADQWCGQCPKCLFTALILSPFLDDQALNRIFGQDLTMRADLIPLLDELAGWSQIKPFECVGTVHEVRAAVAEAAVQRKEHLPCLFGYAAGKLSEADRQAFRAHLDHLNPEHHVPSDLATMVARALQRAINEK